VGGRFYGRGKESSLFGVYNRPVYSSQLLDHFQNPRNVGDVEAPDASAELSNPACGDILRLSVKIEGGRIADVRFRAKGCVPAMACGSAITEMVRGRTLMEARKTTTEELLRAVGGLPEASSHAAHLAVDTLLAVLAPL
jgi:nitrogen fixation NifU-like protein